MFPRSLFNERVLPRILEMPKQVDRFLEDVFGPGAAIGEGRSSPAVDIRETDEALVIVAELPGVKQEDVEVTVADGALTIRGEREAGPADEGQVVLRRERTAGPFVRHILLPESIDGAAVTAAYRDGVLTIRAPKQEAARSRRIAIEAN
jgi:HSP20 family protein